MTAASSSSEAVIEPVGWVELTRDRITLPKDSCTSRGGVSIMDDDPSETVFGPSGL